MSKQSARLRTVRIFAPGGWAQMFILLNRNLNLTVSGFNFGEEKRKEERRGEGRGGDSWLRNLWFRFCLPDLVVGKVDYFLDLLCWGFYKQYVEVEYLIWLGTILKSSQIDPFFSHHLLWPAASRVGSTFGLLHLCCFYHSTCLLLGNIMASVRSLGDREQPFPP